VRYVGVWRTDRPTGRGTADLRGGRPGPRTSTTDPPTPTTKGDLWEPPKEEIERNLIHTVLIQTRRMAPYSSTCNAEVTTER
jgi:hypothetical protein